MKDQFPIFQAAENADLVYLDNAATTQKPKAVLDVMADYYAATNANVHRGVHRLSQQATDQFDAARVTVQRFINAADPSEIIFTKGCTEALNLVAQSWGRANLRPGDQILLSGMEHHANIVPWQIVADQTGATVVPIPIHADGSLDMGAYRKLLSPRVRIVGVKHVCNAIGTINPVREIVALARSAGAISVIDGAQALAHEPVDVQAIGCDFYAMSAHKVYGPMGVGALYGRREMLDAMPPYQAGGDMIRTVSWTGTTYNVPPNKFEPGTPNVPGVLGFAAALDWVRQAGLAKIAAHENELRQECEARLDEIDGIRIIGNREHRAGIVSFVADFAHPHDLGTVLDQHGVAVRTGHHCCMPLMQSLGVPATARASFAVYNEKHDISVMIEALKAAQSLFK